MPRDKIELPHRLEHLVILDDEDRLDQDLEPDLPDELLLRMHRVMLLARRFDERRLQWQRSGRIGTFGPVIGQEAAQIGAVATLRESDWMVPSFREPAAALWRGLPLTSVILHDAGFNEGAAIPEDSRNLPIAVPVASQIPHAVGLAHAVRHFDGDDVVLCFFGDGATSEGDFHEGLNWAGVFRLPVVFVCQNNQWAISVPRDEQTASETLAQKALAYGFSGLQADGNDILASYVATQEAVERARAGEGPTLIELVTYRLSVHTTADDPGKYRSKEEEETWAGRDPLPRYQRYLKGKGLLDDDQIEELEGEIKAEITKAWEEAKQRMDRLEKETENIFQHVYAELPRHLREQRRILTGGDGDNDG